MLGARLLNSRVLSTAAEIVNARYASLVGQPPTVCLCPIAGIV